MLHNFVTASMNMAPIECMDKEIFQRNGLFYDNHVM
jgi:hypothetical protein